MFSDGDRSRIDRLLGQGLGHEDRFCSCDLARGSPIQKPPLLFNLVSVSIMVG